MIKIGIISDTHIHDSLQVLPEKALQDFKTADLVIHSGDLVDLSVLGQLRSVCKNVVAVWGNMDPAEIKNELAEKEIIKAGKHRIGVIHGFGHPSKLIKFVKERFKDDCVDIIIFGHSHVPFNEKIGKIIYFNPGSLTDKMFAPYNSYGIIEINDEIKAKIVKI